MLRQVSANRFAPVRINDPPLDAIADTTAHCTESANNCRGAGDHKIVMIGRATQAWPCSAYGNDTLRLKVKNIEKNQVMMRFRPFQRLDSA